MANDMSVSTHNGTCHFGTQAQIGLVYVGTHSHNNFISIQQILHFIAHSLIHAKAIFN